ncbi:hypothetical protein TGAMA5MH_07492 [Trichoderma gamsii]|uniref:Uncharacterized protein n=1 Tax=Trichoderma gamsii TaxID=398673 RepID=A0A2K0T4P3_9HYPO|nr:hypothetical protein TGAMA5MH_07492 [Trichoderma gamsii]
MKSLTLLVISVVAAKASPAEPIRPNHDSAKANANHIFNAIHSAGRQWGSSLNHNGFGFMPVTLSAGTLLYHGGYSKDPPKGLEWLAFEVEHAENFVRMARHPPIPPKGPDHDEQPHAPSSPQKPLGQIETDHGPDRDPEGRIRGYLQTYQTTRDVQLLYVDGSGAAKSPIGTLDSQDYVLFPNSSWEWYNIQSEMKRATAMCDMITKWGWAGIMRMEIGYEVIWCDFKSDSLHHESSVRGFLQEDRLKDEEFITTYLWARAVAERYDGLGGDRVKVDFSSMVSGFFFPINISNTDPERPDLIRLKAAKPEHRLDISAYLQKVFAEPRRFNVNWQGVVDMIVTRFSKRLAAMSSTNISTDIFIGELERAVLTYYEAPSLPDDATIAADDDKNKTAEAIDRCSTHYLKSAQLSRQKWTLQDGLIHTALSAVVQRICSDLYLMRSLLLQAAPDTPSDAYFINKKVNNVELDKAVNQSRAIVRNLVDELAWTTWKKPQLCAENEVLMTPMWPFGNIEDYYNPGCVPFNEITEDRRGYWKPYEKRPRDF